MSPCPDCFPDDPAARERARCTHHSERAPYSSVRRVKAELRQIAPAIPWTDDDVERLLEIASRA